MCVCVRACVLACARTIGVTGWMDLCSRFVAYCWSSFIWYVPKLQLQIKASAKLDLIDGTFHHSGIAFLADFRISYLFPSPAGL